MSRVCDRCKYPLMGKDEHPTTDACLQILVKEHLRLYDWIANLSRKVGELDSRTVGSIRFGAIAPWQPAPKSDGLEWTKDPAVTKEQVVEVLRQKEAVIAILEASTVGAKENGLKATLTTMGGKK